MFRAHEGGEEVRGGVYWGCTAGEFVSVPVVGGILPGGLGDRYYEAPVLLALAVGPLLGLAFALFLPLSGLLAVASLLAIRVSGIPFWPGPPRREPDALSARRRGSTPDASLVALAGEIAEKRWQELHRSS